MLGSRGSDLALAQAKMVERALRSAWPELEIATEIIRTSGDEELARGAGGGSKSRTQGNVYA